jgi:class I fructose-bisphosphate aldolase/fructose-bisphosphate aldolase/2-amino-3,7-dideoxy-D-threo-hept-6-ulosonate synthase
MGTGKQIRWRRFLSADGGHALVVPIDHGLTLGPIPGVSNVADMGRWIRHPSITGVIAHKGIVERLAARGLIGGGVGVMVHLNGMSTLAPYPDRKEMLTTVESALRLGADAVSVQVNFDGDNDAHNLAVLGGVVDSAAGFGLPVLAMVYDKVKARSAHEDRTRLRHLMRIAIELGVDAVKIAPPENLLDVAPLVEGLVEDVAVLFAGGALCSDEADVLSLARAARRAGAVGLCVGRNTFQRPAPGDMLERMRGALAERVRPSGLRISQPQLAPAVG